MLIGWTLGRYLSTQFLRTILMVFGTVFALVYTLDFVELMRRAGDAEGATSALMAQLALYRTPAVAEQIFPFAVLFGSMAALLQLSRRLELVVARAAGISAWQFLQPGMLVALTIGALSVAAYNPLSAYLKQKATEIEAKIFAKNLKLASSKDLWIRQKSLDGQAIIRAETAVERTTTIARVSVFTFNEAGGVPGAHRGRRGDAPGRLLGADRRPRPLPERAAGELRAAISSPRTSTSRRCARPSRRRNRCRSGTSTRPSCGPSGPGSTRPATASSTTC